MKMKNLHHYIQDYMGNNRMVVNQDGMIEQITHYYPYGGVIGDISTNENLQKFKFEGKVLAAIEKIDNLRREDEPLGEGKDRSFGLDSYDIHARNYFAMLPMWDRVDSLAEKYYGISPYVYCGGDPVNKGDYDGKDFIDVIVGFFIGLGTDLIPGSGQLRDKYSPTDAADYNNGLQVADNTAFLAGTLLTVDGTKNAGIGFAVASCGATVTETTAGVSSLITLPTAGAGALIASGGVVEATTGVMMMVNSESNRGIGYDRGKKSNTSNAKSHGKNESHGDGGRAMSKADRRIEELQRQLQNASNNKERNEIKHKIQNITRDAQRKAKGENYSQGNKR